MQKTIRKISLIILLILVLPISAFFIYQFASLNESEKEINKIYLQQLETIIYSINQYSEDIVSSWVNKINTIVAFDEKLNNNIFQKLLSDNNSIKLIFVSDINFNSASFHYSSSSNQQNITQESIARILNDKKPLLEKLQSYLDANYQKIEPLGKITNEDLYLCIFPLRTKDSTKKIGGIFLNPNTFIQQNLAPKISQAGGDEFILSVTEVNKKEIIYSNKSTEVNEIILNKPLWLLPGFALGIKLESGNIEELVTGRYYENLLILGLLFLLLTAGIILIYFNLRKELRLTQLKSDFVANVSHELRTPLSLISMYSETLVLDRLKTEEKKKEYYSVINSETNRLTKIVNSILNFSKMETQTRKYEFQNINLVKLNEEIFKTYDFHIKSKGFSYSIEQQNEMENIYADKDAISEAIINLIENAIKYSGDKKEFKVTINANNKGIYWEIKDSGIGINRTEQKKIFDKFYRVSSGLVHNTKGTGLGLSLVKQIMHAHKGEITVESDLGLGSTFRLQFNKNFTN